ncbi:MAG: CRTAC1 family protein [Pirellulales bacterium]
MLPAVPARPRQTVASLPGCPAAPPEEGTTPADQPHSEDADGTTKTAWMPPDPSEYSAGNPGTADFVDVTAKSGVTFEFTDGGGGKQYLVQTVTAGLALFDYDGDGFIDIYFLNGAPNPGAKFPTPPRNALYKNNGDFTFTDVTAKAGAGDTGFGLGVTVGDYDNDGDADLYLNNFGPNVLYQNNGDGTFTNVTEKAGVQCDKCGAGAADLDLFVANYVKFDYSKYARRVIDKYEFPAGPHSYESEPDVLFRNNGDGSFTDTSAEAGMHKYRARAMGIICFDYDNDHDTDIFIAVDNGSNVLLNNDGKGVFKETGVLAGVAHDITGSDNGSMGVTCSDYDNDGFIDLYVTNYQRELSALYRNLGNGVFADESQKTGAGAAAFPHVKWGTTLADFDHDGDRDLFVACGHFMNNIRFIDDTTRVKVPNVYCENRNGKYVDVSLMAGKGMSVVASSKGAAFDDLDNDGDLDAVILNINGKPTILRNDLQTSRRSIQIILRGRKTNAAGIGAHVKVATSDGEQVAEMHAGSGYQSYSGSRLHFGLGDKRADRIEVKWIGGGEDVITNIPDAPVIVIEEGGKVSTPGS